MEETLSSELLSRMEHERPSLVAHLDTGIVSQPRLIPESFVPSPL